jgi:hypothetical protein
MKKMQQDFKTAQVSVGTAATLLLPSQDGRDEVMIQNRSTTDVALGDANVTTANGFILPGVVGATVTIPATTALYGRVAAGTANVCILSTQ